MQVFKYTYKSTGLVKFHTLLKREVKYLLGGKFFRVFE
jgi:hypothetical protein